MSKKMVEKRRKKRKKECEEEVGISKHLKILCVWGPISVTYLINHLVDRKVY
jgi:hypothetical protein